MLAAGVSEPAEPLVSAADSGCAAAAEREHHSGGQNAGQEFSENVFFHNTVLISHHLPPHDSGAFLFS